jgi:RNA polymerase sigma-70 factor (ECF subfamily)
MDEQELIRGCLAGAPASFRRLVELYGGLVMSVALNILGDRQDAEDACQETFLKVFRNLGRYDGSRDFRAWLVTVACRKSLDLARKKRRRLAFAGGTLSQDPPAPAGSGRGEASSVLPSRLLEGLSPRERAVLELWAVEEMKPEEIAAAVGCSPATVRVHLFRARKKVKRLLEKGHEIVPAY